MRVVVPSGTGRERVTTCAPELNRLPRQAPLDVPILRTERLTLRPFTPRDSELVYRLLLADPQVMAGFSISPVPTPQQATIALRRRARHWRANGFGMWAMETGGGQFIGECGLRRLEETGDAEIAYAIVRSHWNRGYASEAAARTVDFAFDVCDLERVVAVTIPQNTASQAVLRRCGFRAASPMEVHGQLLPAFAVERSQRNQPNQPNEREPRR